MTALARHLADVIAREGPISVATFMATALQHPRHGYYVTRDPLGLAGDFVTAPEISQMFGECIGAWAIATWRAQGSPAPFAFVELGPGRGTLMADMLRTARKIAPDFAAGAELHLVETSPALRTMQRRAIGDTAQWHDSIATVPALPLVLVANEFFDALPIRQFVRTERGWCERCVGLESPSDPTRFAFAVAPEPVPGTLFAREVRSAPLGAIAELCPAGESLCAEIAARIAERGGAALIVDYGSARSAPGDSFQAMRAHAYHDPLVEPGSADLTAHVDFAALARAAQRAGARSHGPLTQDAFLLRLGIAQRADLLKKGASSPDQIDQALSRLTAPDQMGTLFKALALTAPGAPVPPGFEIV